MFRAHQRICLTAFLVDFSVMAGLVATPFFVVNQLGGGPGMAGLFGTAQAAAYAAACLVSSRFVSRVKNGLNCATIGLVSFTLLYTAMPWFRTPWICCLVSATGIGSLALVWPALHSWIGAEPDPVQRARHMGWFNISWSFGFAISPLLAGPLYDVDYRLPFVMLFGLCMVILALVRSLPHETEYFGAASAEFLAERDEHDRASEACLYAAWGATLAANLLAGVSRSVFPTRVQELVESGRLRLLFEAEPAAFLSGVPATTYSWLAFGMAFATALVFLVMGGTVRWRHRIHCLLAPQLAAGGAFWLLGHTESLAIMMACFVVVGLNLGVCFFSSTYYSVADPSQKHRRAAINEAAVGIGGTGCIAFGFLAERFGYALPFHATPLLMAAAVGLQLALFRYGSMKAMRRRQAVPQPLGVD